MYAGVITSYSIHYTKLYDSSQHTFIYPSPCIAGSAEIISTCLGWQTKLQEKVPDHDAPVAVPVKTKVRQPLSFIFDACAAIVPPTVELLKHTNNGADVELPS